MLAGTQSRLAALLRQAYDDIGMFARLGGVHLRSYQLAPARAVIRSVLFGNGDSLAVMMPRQSGKNELQAHIQAYLLSRLGSRSVEMVHISPTWRPQAQQAMQRVERVLRAHPLTARRWGKEHGRILRIGLARLTFLSAAPGSNIVGATANLLLSVDEAQDVDPAKYQREIAPMAASTNATRVFWGTAWTSGSLLAQELRAAERQQAEVGRQLAFRVTAEQVAVESTAYRSFVQAQVARLGRAHPLVRTQFFSEELEETGGLLPPERRNLMQGNHPALEAPQAGEHYAMLVDVGGEARLPLAGDGKAGVEQAWARGRDQSEHDDSALTILRIANMNLPGGMHWPVYEVVHRAAWNGLPQAELAARLLGIARRWQVQTLVIDAGGIGAGVASLLERSLPGKVQAFVFSLASKSRLGWRWLALIEAGRYREYRTPEAGSPQQGLQERFWAQAAACQAEILPGAGQIMRWSVPERARHPLTSELLHDDLLVSAALCAALDENGWTPSAEPGLVIRRGDILGEIDAEGY